MDGLAELNNEEEEAVCELAKLNEGRESLVGKTIKYISIGGRMRMVWSDGNLVKCCVRL